MNISIRTKFSLGIVFFFVIILVLFAFSAIQLSKLSKKTGDILTENHVSVVFAREMSDALTSINQEITRGFILKTNPNSSFIADKLNEFEKSLQLEKNNITEVGEDRLVSVIVSKYNEYRDSTACIMKMATSVEKIIFIQKMFVDLNQQLMLLSQMNVKAIELKTDEAEAYANKAWIQMAVLGTFCFLIALSFTYNFASYFNERFTQLYGGINEIVSSNFGHRLHFEGKDEFYEIALVFNEMAESLNKNNLERLPVTPTFNEREKPELQELKIALMKIQAIEEEVLTLISKFESGDSNETT